MPFVATFIVLAFAGVLDTAFLAYKHREKGKAPLACPLGGRCREVTEGQWSTLFGVRNEHLGLLYYLAAFFGILAALAFPALSGRIHLMLLLMTGVGVIFSGYLVFLQWRVIREWCFYCLVSAGITVLLFLNSYHLYAN